MMIKITEKCSMGCSHCLNKATPNGKHMDFHTFKKAIAFQKKYGGSFCIITGGEPTEHPEFEKFLEYAFKELIDCFITITTNGVWLQTHQDYVKDIGKRMGNAVTFQVTSDKRFYPTQIDLSLPVFRNYNVIVCERLLAIYPQGRALDNKLEWDSKGSKCFNIRAIANQVNTNNLGVLISLLAIKQKFCTPHIGINGCIKVGESDLCPNCSHIDKSSIEIMNDIRNFKCNGCNHINKKLPEQYRKVIGEE